MKPMLRWAGGKTRLLPEIKKRLPKTYVRYIEPFIGGGALFFDLLPYNAVISDSNPSLMNVYQMVRLHPENVARELSLGYINTQECYDIVRARFNTYIYSDHAIDQIIHATDFIYLNKTCFNGLWRVNPTTGAFNVPYGRPKKLSLPTQDEISAMSLKLNHCSVITQDFKQTLQAYVRKGDFVYFDPPYVPISREESFTGYTQAGFDIHKQYELYRACKTLTDQGTKFLLSQSYCRTTMELYKEFTIDVVKNSRSIGRRGDSRKQVKEILVRNYELETP